MDATPQRRWYRFSLRTLLVVVTLLCLGPGSYIASEQRKAREAKAAAKAIEELGGIVGYPYCKPGRSAFLRQILGDETYGNVESVTWPPKDALRHVAVLTNLRALSIGDTQVTDGELSHLAGLAKLESLDLKDTQATDAGMVHLAKLNQLTILILENNQVTDTGLSHLAGLTNLKQLLLAERHVTAAGVAELQRALPNCEIIYGHPIFHDPR